MLKFALLTIILGLLASLHFLILYGYFPPAAIFLILPFVILGLLKYPVVFHCQECGINPDEDGFNDPDRELPITFDYTKMGNDWHSKFYTIYLRRLKTGSGTCAACAKRIREQTK
jgi:hypothetical protein